jgi:hypothetical protein
MGYSVSKAGERTVANQRVVSADVTFDGSYTNGGETLSPGDFDLDHIEDVTVASVLTDGSGLPVRYDPSGPSLLVYDNSHTEQSAGAAAVDGETVRLRVRGRS